MPITICLNVGAVTDRASGLAELLATLSLIAPTRQLSDPVTLGADKSFNAHDFVVELREVKVTPHLA